MSMAGLNGGASVAAPNQMKLFEEVFHFFKQQLSSGQLKPGDRLLAERDLAQRLGISRPTLREVMRVLAILGLIEIRPGQGAFVRSADPTVLRDFFSLMLTLQPTLYEGVLEARIAIECQAVRLACHLADDSDLYRIKAALDRVPETVNNTDQGAEADFEFHLAIVRASRNDVLLFIYEALETLLRKSHVERRAAIHDAPEILNNLADEHLAIFRAILSRDEDRAEAEMRRHFRIAQEHRVSNRSPRMP